MKKRSGETVRRRIRFGAAVLMGFIMAIYPAGVMSVSAYTWGGGVVEEPRPTEYTVAWYKPGRVVSTEKKAEEFTVKTLVNGKETALYVSFPKEGGFRLRTDLSGVFEPSGNQAIQYSEANGLTMTAGDTVAVYSASGDGWKIRVLNNKGRQVMSLSNEQISFGYIGSNLQKVKLECAIASEEVLYGTGERYNAFNQVGNSLLLWNIETMYHDSYSDPDNYDKDRTASYKNIPILHSNRGYTLFFNSTYSCEADIGYTDKDKYVLDFNGPKFDMFVWTDTPLENISQYTSLTGRPVLAPKWAFSYWSGANEAAWKNAEAKNYYLNLKNMMEKYDKLGTIPSAVYGEWEPSSDPLCYTLVNKYGSRMLTWKYPNSGYMENAKWTSISYPGEQPLVKLRYTPWVNTQYLDFTHKNIVDYLKTYLTKFTSWGLHGSMLDFGEYISEDTVFSNGMTGDEMHNYYSYFYAKAFYEAYNDLVPDDFILFERSASAGSQAYSANFSGDQAALWSGLKEQVLGILSLSSCGFSIWGGDIGGVLGNPTNELYTRWMQFASFSPLMRSHGAPTFRDPWNYGDEAVKAFVSSYWNRENLVDSVYSAAIRANKTGQPMVNALAVAFPNETAVASTEDEYLFCDDFLVAPVLSSGVYNREVTFPKGIWTSLWTGESLVGGQTVSVDAPLNRIPVYVRQGTVTPVKLAAATLQMGDSMRDEDAVTGLLVTPSTSRRENAHWSDTETGTTYVNEPIQGGFRITAASADANTVVLAKGMAATSVRVDGKALDALEYRDDVVYDEGFYVEGGSQTLIHLPSGWKTIEILGGAGVNYAASATIEDTSETASLNKVLDTTNFSAVPLGVTGDYSLTVDLGKSHAVSGVMLKWANMGYASAYTVEYSEDGEDWYEFQSVKDGSGGVELLKSDAVNARYIRLGELEKKTTAQPMLYGLQVLGGASATVDDSGYQDTDNDYEEDNSVEDPGEVSGEDTESSEDGTASPDNLQGQSGGSSVQEIVYTEVDWPLTMGLIGGGVVLIGGGVTAFLIWRHKKKSVPKE